MTKAHHKAGKMCLQFDVCITQSHDCSTPKGLRLWLIAVLCSRQDSLLWFGTECKSFVRMCTHQSARKAANGFEGDTSKPFVAAGNTLMFVTSLLIFVSSLVRAHFCLEQPSGSCLPQIQPLAGVLLFVKANKITTWLGSFGHESPKPIQLWYSHNNFKQLRRNKPTCASTLCSRNGSRFTGRGKVMKDSQVYPKAFCEAVARLTQEMQDTD